MLFEVRKGARNADGVGEYEGASASARRRSRNIKAPALLALPPA